MPNTEARLCFGVGTHEELREAVRRLGIAAREVLPMEKVKLRGFDDRGKTRLSMKVVDQTTGEDLEAKQKAEEGTAAAE